MIMDDDVLCYDSDIVSAIPIIQDSEIRIELRPDMIGNIIYISLDELEEIVSKVKGNV